MRKIAIYRWSVRVASRHERRRRRDDRLWNGVRAALVGVVVELAVRVEHDTTGHTRERGRARSRHATAS